MITKFFMCLYNGSILKKFKKEIFHFLFFNIPKEKKRKIYHKALL